MTYSKQYFDTLITVAQTDDNVSQQRGVADRWQPISPFTGQTQLTNITANDTPFGKTANIKYIN